MATYTPLSFPAELLSKLLIQLSTTNSVAAVNAFLAHQVTRNAYILSVLNAPLNIRTEVRNEAIANVAADPSEVTEGQKQLVAILTVFEALSSSRKEALIRAFEACATVVGQGGMDVVIENSWQGGHVPPRHEP